MKFIQSTLIFAGALLVAPTYGEFIKLSDSLSGQETIDFSRVSPDTNTVIYIVEDGASGQTALYSVPALGTSPPVALSGAVTANAIGPQYRSISSSSKSYPSFSLDSNMVLYRSDEVNEGEVELYSVPADGSASPRLLSSNLVATEQVLTFEVAPNGTDVVFVGGDESGYNLFRVPIDGSETPVLLTTAVDLRRTDDYEFTVDGTTIYFTSGPVGFFSLGELYTVPLVGGNLKQVTNLDNVSYLNSIESDTYVFFGVRNPIATSYFELYSVRIDGTSAPVKLNPELTSNTSNAYANRLFYDQGFMTIRVSDSEFNVPESLWRVNFDGTNRIRLHPENYWVDTVHGYFPDESTVIVSGREETESSLTESYLSLDGSTTSIPAVLSSPFSSISSFPKSRNFNSDQFLYFLGEVPGLGTETFIRFDASSNTVETPIVNDPIIPADTDPFLFSSNDDIAIFLAVSNGNTILCSYSFDQGKSFRLIPEEIDTTGLNGLFNIYSPIEFAANESALVFRVERENTDMLYELFVATDLTPQAASSADDIWMNYK